MAMFSSSLFSLKDLFLSVVLGVLFGWLLISINDPAHKRFKFDLASREKALTKTHAPLLF
jgi:hypothetical protein